MGALYAPPEEMKKIKNFIYGVLGIKIRQKGCVEFISEGIFGIYSKMKILVLTFFKKVKFEKKKKKACVYRGIV